MSAAQIPVFLLTGFLGGGKTTLLNAARRTPALASTTVVVNELGETGIDHPITSQAIDNVVLLDAGGLCCVNTGALHETLADLVARRAGGALPPFERVIIETSGAADPAALLNLLLGHPLVTAAYTLEATVSVVAFRRAGIRRPPDPRQGPAADARHRRDRLRRWRAGRVPRPAALGSYADYSLYENQVLKGGPVRTIVRGVTVMEGGRIVGPGGHGKTLSRQLGKPPLQDRL